MHTLPCILSRLHVSVHDVTTGSHLDYTDGLWHFVCTAWSASEGVAAVSMDAQSGCDRGSRFSDSDHSFRIAQGPHWSSTAVPIAGGGCFVIGQLPLPEDTSCTMFDPTYSFEGYLSEMSLWSRLLSSSDVRG